LSGVTNVLNVISEREAMCPGSSIYSFSRIYRYASGLYIPDRRNEPLPAIVRRVSGRKSTIVARTIEDIIDKKTKIELERIRSD
jgi:hypothetical protein